MAPFATILLFSLVWLSPFCLGYGIDSSCVDPSNKRLIRRAADSAVEMASQAVEALNAAPRDPDVERLLDLLFRGGPEYRNDPADSDLIEKIQKVYQGVAKFAYRTVHLGQSGTNGAAKDQVVCATVIERINTAESCRTSIAI